MAPSISHYILRDLNSYFTCLKDPSINFLTPIMPLNKIIQLAEQPPMADKSAVGAINQPLQMIGLFCQRAL